MSSEEPLVVNVRVDADVAVATVRFGRRLKAEGLAAPECARLCTVASELARNIVKYALEGTLRLEVHRFPDFTDVRIEAADHGPGIESVEEALKDGFSSSGTLGMGLPGVRRLTDSMEIESTPGVGTRVRISRRVMRRR